MDKKFEADIKGDFKKEVLDRSKTTPVVVDFWASWCMPCNMLKPVLEKVANEYKGKIFLAKVNVQENPELAEEYGVMSIPSVKLFKKGKIVADFSGAIPESRVKEWLDKNL